MRINRDTGEILAGIGKAWWTPALWITQVGNDASGWKTVASNGEVLDEQGFNFLSAGGGKWATYLSGRGPKGNFGPLDPRGFVLDIGWDGTVAWCPNQQEGMQVEGSIALTTRVCDGHIVYALADRRVYHTTLGFAAIPAGVTPFKASVAGASMFGDALLYHTHEHLVLQRFSEPRGVVVADAPAYSPDMVRVPGGYRVVWCPNEGETEIRERVVRDEELSVDLSGLRDGQSPPPHPPPPPEPQPMSLQAPNRQATVAKYIGQHPDWAKDETLRGQIIDLAAADANQTDGGRWGRKSRNPQGTDLNTDGMCFKRDDGLHEIYDAITGSGQSSWDAYGPFRAGENGYWVPAHPVEPPPPQPPPDTDVQKALEQFRYDLAAFRSMLDAVRTDVNAARGQAIAASGSVAMLRADFDNYTAHPPVVKLPELVAKGQTSRSFGHSHTVELPVVPK